MKKCDLINYKTGKRIKAKSVVEFCKKSNLCKIEKNSNINIYPILAERVFSHLGWCLPKYYYKKIELKDYYHNVYKGKMHEISKKYKINIKTLFSLIKGNRLSAKGISLKNTKLEYTPVKDYKVEMYEIESPNSKLVKGKTIKSIHNQIGKNNMCYKSISGLIHGKMFKCKNYKVNKIIISKRRVLTCE